jgi:hypothetical protein
MAFLEVAGAEPGAITEITQDPLHVIRERERSAGSNCLPACGRRTIEKVIDARNGWSERRSKKELRELQETSKNLTRRLPIFFRDNA